jgi:hypothetical protein
LMTLQSDAVRPVGSGELLHTRRRDLAEQSVPPERR